MILAGDIGGTKVNLALFKEEAGRLQPTEEARFESRDYSGLESILDEYLKRPHAEIHKACFGVAGPVRDGKSRITNLSWDVDAQSLRKQLGQCEVFLINDLAAMACAAPFLDASELLTLQTGQSEREGRITVLAAGTGLGEAFLLPGENGRYRILDSEGGHCDFASRNKVETELLDFLLRQFDRVSVERILSGAGLLQIYRFFREVYALEENDAVSQALQGNDPVRVIVRCGMEKKSQACERTLGLFVSIYGAVAGNLALQFLSDGGVYVGGGIAPSLAPLMVEGGFMEAFLSKGRFRPYLERVPVKVILNDRASLLGAAHYAMGKKFIH